jgi:hypothetical protein
MPLTTSIDDLFAAASQAAAASSGGTGTSDKPVYTGRYIAIFKPDATADAIQQFLTNASVKSASATSFDAQAVSFSDLGDAEVLVFPNLGLALVSADAYTALLRSPNDNAAVASADGTVPAETTTGSAADSPLDSWEQETFFYADDDDTATATPADPSTAAAANVTCGLDICVLDTGIDLNHPDFSGRTIVSSSFIPGQAVQDGHSHGTHTAGTAAGPQAPASGPRYGIAYNASLYIGKVLSDGGTGVGGSIIAGMNWALANNCDIISMSLRSPVATPSWDRRRSIKSLCSSPLPATTAAAPERSPTPALPPTPPL